LEWDGLVRLCFSRKNKTLGAIFKQDNVVNLLEQNYKTFCAMNNEKLDPNLNMKEKINVVLTENEFNDQRSSKLGLNDFLKLLTCFHAANLHFC